MPRPWEISSKKSFWVLLEIFRFSLLVKESFLELGHGGVVATNDTAVANLIEQEISLLPKFDSEYVAKMAKYHRKVYYFLYDLGVSALV